MKKRKRKGRGGGGREEKEEKEEKEENYLYPNRADMLVGMGYLDYNEFALVWCVCFR